MQDPQLNTKDWHLYKRSQAVKQRYRDGEPLNAEDRAFILSLLRRHPNGRSKFGTGVRDVVVHPYVGETRCFFVVRGDGTVEDFSIQKCLGRPGRRSPLIAALMAKFRYGRVLATYRRLAAKGPSAR